MKYTIFINNKPIYLTDEIDKKTEVHFYEITKVKLIELFQKIGIDKLNHIFLYHPDLKKGWKLFKEQFKVVKAAGGVVQNHRDELLFIFRNGVWDLPKGKLEKNEKTKKAALREVKEECGIDGLKIKHKLPKTYHIYWHKERYVLKITYWYSMFSSYQGVLTPQTEEGISRVDWISSQKMKQIFANTYANINLLLTAIELCKI